MDTDELGILFIVAIVIATGATGLLLDTPRSPTTAPPTNTVGEAAGIVAATTGAIMVGGTAVLADQATAASQQAADQLTPGPRITAVTAIKESSSTADLTVSFRHTGDEAIAPEDITVTAANTTITPEMLRTCVQPRNESVACVPTTQTTTRISPDGLTTVWIDANAPAGQGLDITISVEGTSSSRTVQPPPVYADQRTQLYS